MAYQKTVWVDQDVENPRTYVMRDNGNGTTTLLDAFGSVTELGTPVNAANMNKIENGIANLETQVNTKINAGTASEIFKSLLSYMYPVGSIYIGTQTTCPMSSLIRNSTWELVAANKALWTGNGANANTTIEAGLPNHTHGTGRQSTQNNGSFVWNNQNEDYVLGTQAGSIYYNGSGDYNYQNSYDAGAGFNESLGNTYTLSTSLAKTDNLESDGVFGNSTTVQPPAYVVNVWRRVA